MALHLFPLLCLHPDDEGIVAGSFDIKYPHKNYDQRYGLLCPKRTKRGWATDSLSGLSRFWWRGQRKERSRDNWGWGGREIISVCSLGQFCTKALKRIYCLFFGFGENLWYVVRKILEENIERRYGHQLCETRSGCFLLKQGRELYWQGVASLGRIQDCCYPVVLLFLRARDLFQDSHAGKATYYQTPYTSILTPPQSTESQQQTASRLLKGG